MNILFDTHTLIWALADSRMLTLEARTLILNPDNNLFFTPISLWEIEVKRSLHPDEFNFTAKDVFNFCCEANYKQVILKAEDIFLLSELKRNENAPKHKDPFDRMILCQAKSENLQLLTHDKKLAEYNFDNVILF